MARGDFVRGDFVQGDFGSGGFCPRGILSGGILSGGILTRGILSGGILSCHPLIHQPSRNPANLFTGIHINIRNTVGVGMRALQALVSIIAMGSIVAWVLILKCFLFVIPIYTHVYAIIVQ